MSDEYDAPRHERHHHRRENEDEYDAPPRREESEYGSGYDQPPRRGEYESERPPRRQEGGYDQGGGYNQGGYSDGSSGADPVQTDVYQQTYATDEGIAKSRVEVTKHKREEEGAGLGGLAAGAFAMYEAHEVKKDPEHARRHKLEEELAGTGAVGAEGFALYERHEKKNSEESLGNFEEKLEGEVGGEKKHGWFG